MIEVIKKSKGIFKVVTTKEVNNSNLSDYLEKLIIKRDSLQIKIDKINEEINMLESEGVKIDKEKGDIINNPK